MSDVIIVMSGGLDENGGPNSWVRNRLDMAISLYRKERSYILCTSAGTYHKPPVLDINGYPIYEASASAKYLIDNGIDPKDIIRENLSYDSLGCVYYSLLLFIIPRNWRNICVITCNFHMPRVRVLFEWIFNLYDVNFNFEFCGINDDSSMPIEILKLRIEKEFVSLCNIKENLIPTLKSISMLDGWIYTVHKSYSCIYLNGHDRDEISDRLKSTY